ncbi:homeobox-leucine zipper family protein / lipid-binding START domain-containing protein isoform X2 [Wolffia australiana]
MAMVVHQLGQGKDNNGGKSSPIDAGKYVRYTAEQVEALERVYAECPKPSSLRRQQLIRECPILSNIEPKQIKVWFQNRRCREKQRKESTRLQTVNRKLSAMNKLLMEENDRLQKQVSHLTYENGFMRQQLHTTPVAAADNSCESVVTSGQNQRNPTPQHPPRDASNPAGLLAIAEETAAEFLAKATGTAVDWVPLLGMKPGPDSLGIFAVSYNCGGVAARACSLVSLEPAKVAEVLKDRPSWYRDCRRLDVHTAISVGNGGLIELLYMQTYTPTTIAAARDFWTIRYTTALDDGGLVISERSLSSAKGGPAGPEAPSFVRAEMLPSGYLIRPCEGGGSMIHIVDHVDLDAWSVPEVLRPLYESPKILAQKMTIAALRHVRQIALEANGEIAPGGGRQPAALRSFSQRLSRGFNDAISGFMDDGWSPLGSDGSDDVVIAVNSSPGKHVAAQSGAFPALSGVLCAKASMLLHNVPPAVLVRFLREHRSEWADCGAEPAAAMKIGAFGLRAASGIHGGQVILPLAQTLEQEEFLEVVKLENQGLDAATAIPPRDVYVMQLCSGLGEGAAGSCAQLVFAPIDESFADDAPLLPSGFRVILLDPKSDGQPSSVRTLDLTSTMDTRRPVSGDGAAKDYPCRSVLTIAFQFAFEPHLRDHVAAMARQYVRSVVLSVQRVAMAIAPSRLGLAPTPPAAAPSPEAATLAHWICRSYSQSTGVELLKPLPHAAGGDSLLKLLWHHPDSIICCSLKISASAPCCIFANQAGLDMLETTLVALQDITLDRILDDATQKTLYSQFPKIMQQGFAHLRGGVCTSSMGRPASFDQAVAWRVADDTDDVNQYLAFVFTNWSFV